MLHGYSKPLELSWEEAFAKFGNGNRTVSQLIYSCWYLQERIGENFKHRWEKITKKACKGRFMKKPILSRWGYPLTTASMIFEQFNNWVLFITGEFEGENKSSILGQTATDTLKLIKNTEIKVQLSFLDDFRKR